MKRFLLNRTSRHGDDEIAKADERRILQKADELLILHKNVRRILHKLSRKPITRKSATDKVKRIALKILEQ